MALVTWLFGSRYVVPTACPLLGLYAGRVWELAMLVYAEIIDSAGAVVARTEADVSQDGDLAVLVLLASDRFQELHPDQSLMTELGKAGLTVRFGMVEEVT